MATLADKLSKAVESAREIHERLFVDGKIDPRPEVIEELGDDYVTVMLAFVQIWASLSVASDAAPDEESAKRVLCKETDPSPSKDLAKLKQATSDGEPESLKAALHEFAEGMERFIAAI